MKHDHDTPTVRRYPGGHESHVSHKIPFATIMGPEIRGVLELSYTAKGKTLEPMDVRRHIIAAIEAGTLSAMDAPVEVATETLAHDCAKALQERVTYCATFTAQVDGGDQVLTVAGIAEAPEACQCCQP